jgi:hypothetical protein
LFLSTTTHLVKIADDIVVLDARTNAYYCLPAASAAIQVNPDGLTFDDPDLADQFVDAGFLVHAPVAPPLPGSPRPHRDLAQAVAEHVRLGDVGLILAAWLTMLPSYYGVSFRGLIRQGVTPDPTPGSAEPSEEVRRLTATFERVLPWLPFQGVCLYRAFLLKRVLRWRGHRTRWVFGVRTWPFLAHCWLQIGDVVLDDAAERLVGFSPILEV